MWQHIERLSGCEMKHVSWHGATNNGPSPSRMKSRDISQMKRTFRDLEFKLKGLEDELKICRLELRNLTRKQQELAQWNDELQKRLWEMKYQDDSLNRKNSKRRNMPHEAEREKGIISYWCCGEEHQKRECPHKKKGKKKGPVNHRDMDLHRKISRKRREKYLKVLERCIWMLKKIPNELWGT